jgi:acyl-CoA reductase-like NAD-dependent aldehyde dehydrogenase
MGRGCCRWWNCHRLQLPGRRLVVCGNTLVWKLSEKTPLTALAVQALFERTAERIGDVRAKLSSVLIGGRAIGEVLVDHPKVPLASATGSTAMGRAVGPRLARPRDRRRSDHPAGLS